ncbi:MAG TPA: hypothetical protein VGC65_02060 [Bacteroidia bacterium]|jgi:hypothetical protein
MNNTIHIPEPCPEKWAAMKTVAHKQRHCDVCKHKVHDFSKSSLREINQKINSAEGIFCGHYHERHTTNAKGSYTFINHLENKLIRINFRKFSVVVVAALLIISGCARKHVKGKRRASVFDAKHKQSAKEF